MLFDRRIEKGGQIEKKQIHALLRGWGDGGGGGGDVLIIEGEQEHTCYVQLSP